MVYHHGCNGASVDPLGSSAMASRQHEYICLWFIRDAHEAATFYASTFPDSRVTALHPGEILMDDFMEPLGISIKALARRTVGADVDRSVKARVA